VTAQVILQMLALEMMQQKEERVDQATLLKRLAGYLKEQEEAIAATEFLKQIEQISELLVQREPEEFEFPHLSFQEYLAAKEVVRRDQESLLLYEHFGEDWWKPVILLYVAQVKKPSGLIRAAMERGAKDLAYACSQETSKRIDDDLKGELEELQALRQEAAIVQSSRYLKLEEYLKNQQWKDADRETYRLMITTVGKEEGQWFTRELLNFPCEELRAIDGLWVNHSNGHFGFSVQKKIYVEYGGKLDGEDPSDEVWEALSDHVGWRENNEWLDYSELDPSFSSPQGIFPVLGGGWGFVFGGSLRWCRVWWVLFSRTKTCEL